jgi:hypothetical protein
MPGAGTRRRSEVPVLLLGVLAFAGYVWLLAQATPVVVTVFGFASDNRPKLYAAYLAVLTGLPGLLWTLPRALRRPAPHVPAAPRSRRENAVERPHHVATDLLGIALILLAQVPLPAPWGPAGKAATIANITRSPEIVELSAEFATYSLGVFAVGVVAAVLAKVYAHAAAQRVIAIILAVGAPVVAWVLVLRALS